MEGESLASYRWRVKAVRVSVEGGRRLLLIWKQLAPFFSLEAPRSRISLALVKTKESLWKGESSASYF